MKGLHGYTGRFVISEGLLYRKFRYLGSQFFISGGSLFQEVCYIERFVRSGGSSLYQEARYIGGSLDREFR